MSGTDFSIPESLEKALKDKKVVPFVGAGISMAIKKSPLEPKLDKDGNEKKDKLGKVIYKSIFPSWWEFLSNSADKLDREKIALNTEGKSQKAVIIRTLLNDSPIDYLDIAQRAFDALGNHHWESLLLENFEKDIDSADEDSKKLAKLMWQFGNNLVLTTNVDRVLDSVYEGSQRVKILDTQSSEFADIQTDWYPSRPTVLHIHGQIDDRENVVFTKNQYEAFYNLDKNKAKLDTLQKIFSQRTILFIGFSLDDLFILRELERVNLIYKGGANRFYALIREDQKTSLHTPSYVRQVNFSEFGKPLEDLVEELVRIAKIGDEKKKEESQTENKESEKTTEKARLKNHFNVPFASKGEGFVGRIGKIEEIWTALSAGRRAAIGQAVSIEGFGGLGKTQLAVEYAHEYRDRYENGVYWLTADEDMSVQLIKIGESLHWILQSDTGFDQAELVRNRFRKLSDCLIIFDNVDDQQAIKDYLPEVDYHPHILVTSREEQHGFQPINLDTLSESEARDLLTQIANREPQSEAEEKALENILKELDGLPLAVELVGGYLLRRRSITFQDYFEYLENEPIDRIEERFPDSPFAKRNKSIIRALKISEKLLNETEYLEEILDILAWSGKSSMGYSLLRDLVGTDDNLPLKDALGVALELHFIKKEENEERYAIHRLLAKVRQFEKPLKERKEWHQETVRKMVGWFRKRKDDFEYLKEFEAEIVHLQQWQSQSSEILPVETVYLTDFEAYPLWHRGNYQESEFLLEKALNLYQKNQLNDEKLLSNLYNDLGVIKGDLGNIRQSFEYREKAFSIGQTAFDKKSEDIAKFLDNLGNTYGDLDNYQKALQLQQQALEIRRELFGEKHPIVAVSLVNLGNTYGKLGNHQKALELKQEGLEIYLKLFGEKHPAVALSLNSLGITYVDLGNYEKALQLQQQALEIRRKLIGEKHPDVALTLHWLGFINGKLNNKKEAELLLNQALGINQEILGNYHPTTIRNCSNLINELIKNGKIEKAGRLAGEFLSYVPQDNPDRPIFEKYGGMYRKAKQRKKKRRH